MAICYLIKHLNSRKKSYYKIGVSSSKNAKERVRHLQTGNPNKLVTVQTHKLQTKHSAEKLEQYILRELESLGIKRCQGEWVFGDSKKIESVFDYCIKIFSELTQQEIKSMKRWSFARGSGSPSVFAKKSVNLRRNRARVWREETKLTENIKSAIKQLKKPTLQKISEILNNKGLETIRGKQWSQAHLSIQLKTMGFQKWQDLV
jgi:hypothetical protein